MATKRAKSVSEVQYNLKSFMNIIQLLAEALLRRNNIYTSVIRQADFGIMIYLHPLYYNIY